MARLEGIEPPTHGLEGRCSIRLSYRRVQASDSLPDTIPRPSRKSPPTRSGPPTPRRAAGHRSGVPAAVTTAPPQNGTRTLAVTRVLTPSAAALRLSTMRSKMALDDLVARRADEVDLGHDRHAEGPSHVRPPCAGCRAPWVTASPGVTGPAAGFWNHHPVPRCRQCDTSDPTSANIACARARKVDRRANERPARITPTLEPSGSEVEIRPPLGRSWLSPTELQARGPTVAWGVRRPAAVLHGVDSREGGRGEPI